MPEFDTGIRGLVRGMCVGDARMNGSSLLRSSELRRTGTTSLSRATKGRVSKYPLLDIEQFFLFLFSLSLIVYVLM
jgi:hypothetical protein